jgi:glycine cleavage system H lipoate-binding protein
MSMVSSDEAVSIEAERAADKVQEPVSGAFPY